MIADFTQQHIFGFDAVGHRLADRRQVPVEVDDTIGLIGALVFVIEFDKQLGGFGNRRINSIGDHLDIAAPLLAVDDSFINFEMTQRGIVDQSLIKTA